MVLLRWAISHTHNPRNLLALHHTLARSIGQDCASHFDHYCPHSTRYSPVSSPFSGYMVMAGVLLCLRVRLPFVLARSFS